MEHTISKHEARHIMLTKGRLHEYDALVHRMLPALVEEWVSQGLNVSIEHCFIRINGAVSLKISCISPNGNESHSVLLNGDATLFPIFSCGKLKTVVTAKRLNQVLSQVVRDSALRLHRNLHASNDAKLLMPQSSAAA